jgi:gluconolactonase
MTIDEEGNLYLTGRGVTVVSSSGKRVEHIEIPKGWTANVCFGGADRKTLFVTALDSVFTLRMKVAGLASPAAKVP